MLANDLIADADAVDAMRSVQTALDAIHDHTRAVTAALHRINCWLGADQMTQAEWEDLRDAALALGRAERAAEDAAAHIASVTRVTAA